MSLTIVIIGGGAAGVSVLAQLTKKYTENKQEDVKIIVIEKNDNVGPGLAYSTEDNSHIINLSAENMSPIPGDPKHFIKWLQSKESKWKLLFPDFDIQKCSFPPRALFGMYLIDLAKTTQERAQENGIKITFMKGEVVDIDEKINKNTKFEISLVDDSIKVIADQVILCIGHLPPTDYKELISKPGYFHSPWPTKQLSHIPKDKDVHIIGTRLTAIDIVLALVERGHTGKITMVSRYGLLPCVIGPSESYTKRFLTLENIVELTANGTQPLKLSKLKELFLQEIEYAEGKHPELDKLLKTVKSIKSPEKWLEKEIELAESKKRPWQSVLASLYPIVPNIWNMLGDQDKKEFLEKYYSLWMTYLAAFPIQNAKKILALLKKGQLEIRGGLQSIKFNPQDQIFEILLNDNKSLKANYLINGIGAGHDITKIDSQLLKNLLAKKLVIPYPIGGIDIDFKTLNVKGYKNHEIQIIKNFFAVGDGTNWGACMATADLGQIDREAIQVANSSLEQIHNKTFSKGTSVEMLKVGLFLLNVTKTIMNICQPSSSIRKITSQNAIEPNNNTQSKPETASTVTTVSQVNLTLH
jgi:uncharacterized NAD(P)/FAD-binding protein YdhS